MDEIRARTPKRSRPHDTIELGHEAPLSVDGGDSGFVDRRRVSVQWFAGTILTALCGAALMGGAVFTSLDGETNFATLPERVEVALRGALTPSTERLGARKGDRLQSAEEPSFAKQVIRVSTTSRVGNHEVVRVRPFVRVAGNLALSVSSLSADIPPFNPQAMLAENSPSGTSIPEDAPAAEPDAEVSFVMRDLEPMMPRLKIALQTPTDDVMTRVKEAAEWSEKSASHLAGANNITGIKLAYAGPAAPDPYAGFEARIVPENITLLPKTANQTTGGNAFNEKIVIAKKGDTVSSILKELGAAAADIGAVTSTLGAKGRDPLKDGQKLRVLMSPAPGAPAQRPVRVIVANENTVEAVAALSDAGKYVAVDVRNVDSEVAQNTDQNDEENDDGSGVRLYQSVYETALRNQIPRPLIDELIKIYSYDVDFQRKVQPGDSFEVLYAGEEETPGADNRNDVLFAALTVGGEVKKFYRFQSPDDGLVDYYDESGKSAKKFLVRKPLVAGIMRSGFGIRRHPILGYTKMHTGVDWAAPTGTPIYAAGNGVVEKEGWESGYGKFILVKHNNGYETAYGHMSAFARGMEVGKRVRQGQVIGFVGSTGLSTGSHVHYEIRVNGRFVDPMRIKLPRGRELTGSMMATFEQERDRLDGIMARKPARMASSAK
ncbi:M23 family metallopeptidase [Undibacter mobilis]|uniref:M23 family metallopeptidase n=1 Tax=Undibacter mobilis TaxID=2292256 RepID=UPI001FDF5A2E|nr:M23 family metallopeptidase [Undibacter mobilis]